MNMWYRLTCMASAPCNECTLATYCSTPRATTVPDSLSLSTWRETWHSPSGPIPGHSDAPTCMSCSMRPESSLEWIEAAECEFRLSAVLSYILLISLVCSSSQPPHKSLPPCLTMTRIDLELQSAENSDQFDQFKWPRDGSAIIASQLKSGFNHAVSAAWQAERQLHKVNAHTISIPLSLPVS